VDVYALLGVSFPAVLGVLKKAHRNKARELHPDKNKDKSPEAVQAFIDVQKAWELLQDPAWKEHYDNKHRARLEREALRAQTSVATRRAVEDLERREAEALEAKRTAARWTSEQFARQDTQALLDELQAAAERQRVRKAAVKRRKTNGYQPSTEGGDGRSAPVTDSSEPVRNSILQQQTKVSLSELAAFEATVLAGLHTA
jgi:DnaJ-class molecular chaperone